MQGEQGETRQAVGEGSAADYEPLSVEDETSDEEFLPPASDAESPDEEGTADESEGGEEEDRSSQLEEEGAIPDQASYTAKDGTKWGKAPARPNTKTKNKNIFRPPPTRGHNMFMAFMTHLNCLFLTE